jgi:hypothetical protein
MTASALLLTLFITAPPSTECSPTAKHKKEILARLEKCNRTPRPFNNCDDIAGEVLTWYDCGDSALIDPLLAASAHSDGSMSDLLGGFLGDLIVAKPELLLRHVSRRSAAEQQAIGQLTLDGGEIPDDQLPKVEADLKRLASNRDGRIAKTSRMWLKVLEDVHK